MTMKQPDEALKQAEDEAAEAKEAEEEASEEAESDDEAKEPAERITGEPV